MRLQNKLLLSLIISSAVLVVLMLGLMQWSVERGMLDYVNIQEEARLAPVLQALAAIYQQNDSWHALQDDPRRFHRALRTGKDSIPRLPKPLGPPPHRDRSPLQHDKPPPPPGPPKPKPQLFDGNKQLVTGSETDSSKFRLLAIKLNDETVGWLALPVRRRITDGFELRFLEQQTTTFITIGLIVIALAMVVAFLLSRHLLKPITSLALATDALRRGEFASRLEVDRKDELGQLARDFNELADSLQQSDASRKRWFADVSHELRTPLAILYAEIEAMLDGVRPFDRAGILSIQQEIIHLNTLVDDIYTLSSADLGSLQYHKETINLSQLVDSQLSLHRGPLHEAGLRLHLEAPGTDIEIYADHTRLCQLLNNLLVNSRKYTNVDGEVVVTLSADTKRATIVIEDSFPGVPSEALGSLFDHLYRVETSRNRATGGSGLGLAICQRIVEAHGGIISVAPSSLGGLAVTVQLPLL